MALSAITYALGKKYTDETAIQFGGLKGASCKIKSIVKEDDRNVVTFEWTNDEGETRTSVMYVNDGTPIYNWSPGYYYRYGDLAIYQSAFYRCITANADAVFDNLKWNEIGSPDGNYDIVQSADLLPTRFTSADKKMYYCINDVCFYLWDGYNWIKQEKKATYENLGMVIVDEKTLNVDEDGLISIHSIEETDIQNLFKNN